MMYCPSSPFLLTSSLENLTPIEFRSLIALQKLAGLEKSSMRCLLSHHTSHRRPPGFLIMTHCPTFPWSGGFLPCPDDHLEFSPLFSNFNNLCLLPCLMITLLFHWKKQETSKQNFGWLNNGLSKLSTPWRPDLWLWRLTWHVLPPWWN